MMTIYRSTEMDRSDFLKKVDPHVRFAVQFLGFLTRAKNVEGRALGLAHGLLPQTRAERDFVLGFLTILALRYGPDEWPAMCPPRPDVEAVQ